MKKTFTNLFAALALLAFFIPSMIAVGQSYDLITSTNDIANGNYVIAAKVDDNYYAMSNNFATKISGTQITVTNGSVSTASASGYVVTIEKDGNGRVSITNGTKYLNCKSSGTNFEVADNAYMHDVTYESGNGGGFLIKRQDATRGVIYSTENSTNKFGNYATTNVNNSTYFYVQLFKYNAGGGSSYTITAQSNNDSYGTVSLSGNVITGAPNSGYRYASPAYSVSPANSATVSQNGNAFTVTPSANTTVTINFEAIPCYTVILSDDPENPQTEYSPGVGVTLPSRSAIGSYEFAGWSETNVANETTTAPATIIPAGTYYPTANITLYPVYTKDGGGAATPSAFSVGDTGDYAIVSAEQNGKYYALPTNPTVNSGKITAEEITVSETGGVKYVTTANAVGFTWTIAAATNGYTLSDGSKYIYHSNGGESGTNVAYGTSTSYTWAFTADGDYVTMAGMSGSTTNNRGMLFQGTTIGGYSLSNANSTGYYKVMILPISAGSTTYYWSNPVAATVEQPVITVGANPFLFSTTATITCATEGATIKYSYDNSTWNDYSAALTITATTTIYAKAVKDNDESSVAQVSVTKNLATPTVTVSGDLTLDLDGETNVSAGTLTATVTYENAAIASATVTWSSNHTDIATIDASTGAVTLLTTGTVTFTATYAGNSDYAEAIDTKTITVIDSNAPGTTQQNPYTVAQAITAIQALPNNNATSDKYYVSGIVSAFYGDATGIMSASSKRYYISDNGTTTNQLLVYSGKGLNNVAFSNDDDLLIGDRVIIYGAIQNYQGNTPEIASGNYIVSLDRPVTTEYYQYSINGVEGEIIETTSGTTIDLPTTVDNIPAGFTFAGWTTNASDVDNIIAGGNQYTINTTVEFFAVYAKTVSGTPITAFNKVTSISEGDYLIVYETGKVAFDGGRDNDEDKIDAVENTINITEFLSNGVILSNSTTNAAIFTIAESESKDDPTYTIQSASGFYIGKTTTGNGMMVDATTKYTNSITFDDSDNAVITASSGVTLRYNDASNQLRFRYFGSGQQAIQLYKKSTITPITTTYYTRVFPANPTVPGPITISGPTIITSGSVLDMGSYTLTSDNAANLIIEDGGQLILKTDNTVKATIKKTTAVSSAEKTAANNLYAIASPVDDIEISSFAQGTQHNVYRYDEPNSYWNEYRSNASVAPYLNSFDVLEIGRGYLYRSNVEGIDFAGDVTGNEVTYNLSYAFRIEKYKGLNLVGNPFTHDISWSNLALSNVEDGGCYVLNEDPADANHGKWQAVASSGSVTIKPMQAFFVQATNDGASVTFNNTAAKGINYANDNIMFSVKNSKCSDEAYVLFKEGHGLNKIEHRNNEIPMLYIINNGQNYAIADMSDDTEVINIGFEAKTMGQYTLSVKTEDQYSYMHLIDKLTGEDVDMLSEDSYTFVGTPNDRKDRFVLRLNYNAANIDTESDIFAYQSGSDIIVRGEGELQIFDVMGRFVMSKHINGVNTINADALSNGVYVLRIIGTEIKTQKIVVR